MNADNYSVWQKQAQLMAAEINAVNTRQGPTAWLYGDWTHTYTKTSTSAADLVVIDRDHYKDLFERSTAAYEKLWRAFLLLAAQMIVLIGTCLWLALR